MDCRRIEELIPLYVECDLESDEARAVLAHLEACESCFALAAEYEASQAWLRLNATPDFDDAMLDDLRRGVMREINEARERPSFFGFLAGTLMPIRAFAVVTALLIVFTAFVLYVYLGRQRAVPNDNAVAERISKPEKAPVTTDLKQVSAADSAAAHTGKKRKPAGKSMSRERQKQDRAVMPETDNTVAQKIVNESQDVPDKTEEMTRIEIQTDDPNIRIIWFSPKESDSELSNPLLETD